MEPYVFRGFYGGLGSSLMVVSLPVLLEGSAAMFGMLFFGGALLLFLSFALPKLEKRNR